MGGKSKRRKIMWYTKIVKRKTKITKIVLVGFCAIAAMATLVVGQADVPGEPPVVLDKTPVLQNQSASELLNSQTLQTISFDKDMTIKDGLRMLALLYKKNIVPTPKVEGPITVTKLYNVTFEEALMAILQTNVYEVQGNFIMAYTAEEYEQMKNNKRRLEYTVFSLSYITADEAKKLIEPILSADGQVAISSPAQTGVPSGQSISSDAGGGDNLAFQDTVVVRDYPENIEQAKQLVAQLDIRPRQVLIEATILSAVLTEDMKFGVDLNMAGGVAIDGSSATTDLVSGDTVSRGSEGTSPIAQVAGWATGGNPIEVAGFAAAGGSGLRLGLRAGDVSVFITALEQITDTTVLANPKILAVNKQLGQVYIGTKIGYRDNDIATASGGIQQGAVKFLDTGTKLAFRPYIGNDGYIRMQIHPKDSSGVLADGVPQETSTEIATNILVKDGQTIVIGGLFRDVVTTTHKQVPILGDIPIIGELFKGTEDSNRREEVIVLLTPHIIDDPAQTNGDKRAEDIALKRIGAREGISWLSAGRLAEDRYAKAVGLYTAGDTAAALCELNSVLNIRPTYLEALRLRDRILTESGDNQAGTIERIMLDAISREDSENWIRL
jgi:type IV pilus assembly protein PilQ